MGWTGLVDASGFRTAGWGKGALQLHMHKSVPDSNGQGWPAIRG